MSEDGFRLNAWLAGVRSRHASGKLSAERVASLDALGMVWDPHRTAWDTGIAATRAYLEANGNVRVPSGELGAGFVATREFRDQTATSAYRPSS